MFKNIFSKRLFVPIIIGAIIFAIGFNVGKVRAQEDLDAKLDVFIQALDIIRNSYVEKHFDSTKVVYGAIRGMLTGLGDPYTRFMEPSAYKEMKMRLQGTYGGIGIYIGMKDNHLIVIAPIPGTPAYKLGLKANDKITTINGKPTDNMSLEEAVSQIRGPQGTKVKLGILPASNGSKAKELDVPREKIEIKSVAKSMLPKQIAYIRLNTFEKQDADWELKKAIKYAQRQNARGLILDLRNNGGGLLQNAITIGSMFIKDGLIVSIVDRNGEKEDIPTDGKVVWTDPMVVLVNGGSASASEILAGALKDDKVALLVGEKTFGKASVQNVRVLSDGSCILVTIAKYLTPSGEDIMKKGIMPDFEVKLTTKEAEKMDFLTEEPDPSTDKQLKKAVEVLENQIAKRAKGND
jgi:carboxyl-terminal processing protease